MVTRALALVLAAASPLLCIASETANTLSAKSRERASAYSEEATRLADRSRQQAAEVTDVRRALIEAVHGDGARIVEQALPQDATKGRAYATQDRAHVIFVSMSMPEPDLRAAMEVASSVDNVHLVFRGVTPDGGVDGFLRRLSALAKGIEPPPPMTIDPPEFKERAIRVVPTIVTLQAGTEIARAEGTANPDWMNEQIASRKGDFGLVGTVFEPIETDMEEMLRAAVAAIDAQAYRRDAERAFWRAQERMELPAVMEPGIRRVDPSVVVSSDIVLPDGKVLVKQGQRINPLLAMPVPFDQRLIVIDASDIRQRRMAKQWSDESKGKRVVVMSTTGPGEGEDFEQWWSWEAEVDQPLTLLSPGVQRSLQVSRVPTWIEAEGGHLVLHEVPVTEGEG